MDHQQRHNPGTLVLKFKKRRFDGGNEIALIRQIEAQRARKAAEATTDKSQESEALAKPMATLKPAEPGASPHPTRRPMEILLRGPLEITVGLLGIATTMVALGFFRWVKQSELETEAATLFRLSVQTIRQGLLTTSASPLKLTRCLLPA